MLFHYRATPYTDIIYLASRGEKNKYITLRGVPDASGNRPILDGNNAVMPSNTGYLPGFLDSVGMIIVGKPNQSVVPRNYGYKPGYLHITGLHIRNARPPQMVTNATGGKSAWEDFSAGIFIDPAEHVVIENCEFNDNGMGIFVNSPGSGDEAFQSRDIRIAKNYFHNNGLPNGEAHDHNSYTEAIGIVYEYNYFGAPIKTTGGDNIKDRSAGVVFRYNYIEDGVTLIALRDPQGNVEIEAAAKDSWNADMNSMAFIYGNIFVARNITQWGDGPNIVSMGDGIYGDGRQIRYGKLFFYGNRVVSLVNSKVPLFGPINTRLPMTTVARNNLFYASGTQPFALFIWQGPADFQSNWINKYVNVLVSSADGGMATGTKFDGSGLGGLTASTASPGFVNAAAGNYLTTASSPFASLNAALPSEVTTRGLTISDTPPVVPFGK